jgi:hypothetical protein
MWCCGPSGTKRRSSSLDPRAGSVWECVITLYDNWDNPIIHPGDKILILHSWLKYRDEELLRYLRFQTFDKVFHIREHYFDEAFREIYV